MKHLNDRLTVSGIIVDATTRQPLRQATVRSLRVGALTDSLGWFSYSLTGADSLSVHVEKTGYSSVVLTLPATDKLVHFIVMPSHTGSEVCPLVITGQRPLPRAIALHLHDLSTGRPLNGRVSVTTDYWITGETTTSVMVHSDSGIRVFVTKPGPYTLTVSRTHFVTWRRTVFVPPNPCDSKSVIETKIDGYMLPIE